MRQKKQPTYRFTTTDKRITNISKPAAPLDISFISNQQKRQIGDSKWMRVFTQKPTGGVYPAPGDVRKKNNGKSKRK